MASRTLSTISLYTGAGGLDLGIEAAGFETRVAIEMDPDAVATLRHNRSWEVIPEDIHSKAASSERILSLAGLKPGEPSLLIGGPPCQPFSKSGYWHSGYSKRLDDPRARTLDEYLRVMRETLPQAFLLENVPGITFNKKSEGLSYLRQEISKINAKSGTNYSFNVKQLNAAQYGVPQLRNRVFVVGERDGKEFQFPTQTHRVPGPVSMSGDTEQTKIRSLIEESEKGLLPAVTAWDALCDLPKPEPWEELEPAGKWAGLLASIPEGSNYLYHTNRGGGLQIFGWRSRYWSMLLKLAKSRPSWTLTAQPGPAIGPFHWENRRLSAAELCALQTFPKSYEILGNTRAVYKQVGNAVPSLLAEIIGLEIKRQFFDSGAKQKPTLSPCVAARIPAPEPVREVSETHYLELVKHYNDHPGTGLGPGAQRRSKAAK